MKNYFYLIFFSVYSIYSQSNLLQLVDEKMRENANSIVLNESNTIKIKASDKIIYTKRKRILFLNEKAMKKIHFLSIMINLIK